MNLTPNFFFILLLRVSDTGAEPPGYESPEAAERGAHLNDVIFVYIVLALIGIAGFLQILGVYRSEIRYFNSKVIRGLLQTITHRLLCCIGDDYFVLRPNEVFTRVHINILELFFQTTIDFFYDAPNLITLLIGIFQVIATYDPAHPSSVKKINLIAVSINYIYTMFREIAMYRYALAFDNSRNEVIYKRLIVDSYRADFVALLAAHVPFVLTPSADLQVGDIILMDYDEVAPAEVTILHATQEFILINTKEELGEDCSTIFSAGQIVPAGTRMAHVGVSVVCQVKSTRSTTPAVSKKAERFPEHMNRKLTIANIIAFATLSIVGALSVFMVYASGSASDKFTTDPNNTLTTYFFSTIAQLNVLLPSMRWIILYFLFVFLVDISYPEVTIQCHGGIRKIDHVGIMYFDKTGTLTECAIDVESIVLIDENLTLVAKRLGLPSTNIAAAIIVLACNDTQSENNQGTSPEEMVIAKYLHDKWNVVLIENPLKPNRKKVRLQINGENYDFLILDRSGYLPSHFCRIAVIEVNGIRVEIRQGGSDRMATLSSFGGTESGMAKSNPNRAFGWTCKIMHEDSLLPLFCARATFTNPPRPSSNRLIHFLTTRDTAVRMLTGDAFESAKFLAKSVQIITDNCIEISRLDFDTDSSFVAEIIQALDSTTRRLCVVIEGDLLTSLISTSICDMSWICSHRVDMVIFRTKSVDKATIVGFTSRFVSCGMMGDAANDKHVLAIPEILSVCMRHGAAPCRVVSDILITEPEDLIDVWTSIKNLHIFGSKRLLVDTCIVGSLTAGFTWTGIVKSGFRLLPKGFLFNDPYDLKAMLIFTSVLYGPSACFAVCSAFSQSDKNFAHQKRMNAYMLLIFGFLGGVLIGSLIPQSVFGQTILGLLIIVAMAGHHVIARHSVFRPGRSCYEQIKRVIDTSNYGPVRAGIVLLYLLIVGLIGEPVVS